MIEHILLRASIASCAVIVPKVLTIVCFPPILSFLFELSERRFDKHSTIFCTLYKKEEWVPRLGRGTFAESIYERYAAHDSIIVDTGDMNMRAIFKNGEKRGEA